MVRVKDILKATRDKTLVKAKYNSDYTDDFYEGVYIGFFEARCFLDTIGCATVKLPEPAKSAQDYVQAKAIADDLIDKVFMRRRAKNDFIDEEAYELAYEKLEYGPAAYNTIEDWREDIRKYLRDYSTKDVPYTGIASSKDVTPEAAELAARMLYVQYTYDFEVDIDVELHLTDK